MQCGKCREEAVTFQQYSGMHLCRRHFIEDIEAKAKHTIRSHGWLRAGDHIGVPVSGDCTSIALLFFLHHLFSNRKDIRITAVIAGTGAGDGTRGAERVAHDLGIPVVSGIPFESPDSEWDRDKSYGGPAREQDGKAPGLAIMNRLGKEHGMTKIATGRCLDDEASFILTNILRGDIAEIFAEAPVYSGDQNPGITPFIAISRDDIELYTQEQGLFASCSNHHQEPDTFSAEITTMLDVYTRRHPATKYSLLHLGENIRKAVVASGESMRRKSPGAKHDQHRFRPGFIRDEVNGIGE